MTDRRWSVLIPTRGTPTTVQFSDTQVLAHAAPTIGCEWVEVVAPLGLAITQHRMLVDECGAINSIERNSLASWLYGTHMHGSPIHGHALVCDEILTSEGFDLAWLTKDAAHQLAEHLAKINQ